MRLFITTIVAVATVSCTGGRRSVAPSGGADSCSRRPPAWTQPTSLWSGPLRVFTVHPASVSATQGSVLILGHPSSPPSTPAADTVFAGLWFRPGESPPTVIRRPPGAKFFLNPVAAVDAQGTPHVLWGEPGRTLADTGDSTRARAKSVWASTLGPDGWTSPTRVAEGDGIGWNGVSASEVVASADGSLHVVVPTDRADVVGALLHLQWTATGWTASTIPLPNAAAYAVLARHDGDLLLVFVSAIFGPAPDLNSVFFTRSSDNGVTWMQPTIVSRSDSAGASEPKIVVSGGSVHLIWGQNYSGGLGAEALRHVESNDRGVTWSARADLPLSGLWTVHGAVADSSGTVHVLFSQFTDGLQLHRARWCGRMWSAPDRVLLRGNRVDNAAVRPGPSGSVDVVASTTEYPPKASAIVTWERVTSR